MTAPPTRDAVTRSARRDGQRIAGVFPIHAPRALMRAHGVCPIEIWGPPGTETSRAIPHVQPYVCTIVRSGLAFLLDHRRELDLVVVPHACDSLQGLGSLLLDLVSPEIPVLTFYMPRNTGPAARVFLVDELRRLARDLAEVTGRSPSDAELMDAQIDEERADAQTADILRDRSRIALPDSELWPLIRLREYVPPTAFAAIADALPRGEPVSGRIPVLLSGIVPEPMSLYDVIGQAGGIVVGDDTAAIGRRVRAPGTSENPLERMAEHLLSGPPDPMLGAPIRARSAHLVALARATGARAVIFCPIKSCEPELFDLTFLRRDLEHAGIRSIQLEIDLASLPTAPDRAPGRPFELPHALRTRVEALLEGLA